MYMYFNDMVLSIYQERLSQVLSYLGWERYIVSALGRVSYNHAFDNSV